MNFIKLTDLGAHYWKKFRPKYYFVLDQSLTCCALMHGRVIIFFFVIISPCYRLA